jgi:hypothetical protein
MLDEHRHHVLAACAVVTLLAGVAIEGFIFPFYFTALILLYYDLRVRNEPFDVAVLAEGMMR